MNEVDENYINFTDIELDKAIRFIEESRVNLQDNLEYQLLISERKNRKDGSVFTNKKN